MEYKGKLYGKVGNSLIPLEATTEDFERMAESIKELVSALSDARDTLVLCTLIDKSNQSDKSVVEAEKVLNKYKK